MSAASEMGPLALTALSAIGSFLLTGAATRYARRKGLLDHPGERHSHSVPTPRGGGAGLVAGLLIFSLLIPLAEGLDFWWECIAPGALLIALLGWWDDHRSLPALNRFFIQLAVSVYLLAYASASGLIHGLVPMLTGGLFIIWMTNLYNFMDGSNGMAGLEGVFAGGMLAWLFQDAGIDGLSVLALLIAACCAGFLPWNLGRARVFMGDVGSLSLGFILAALLVYGVVAGAFGIPVALMVVLPFLVDTTLTLARRVLRGERWYNPHNKHLYQRLISSGWSHGRVALIYQAANLALIMPGILLAKRYPDAAWPLAMALVLAFSGAWYLSINRLGVQARAG
jgi:Fuc2NAc and GlcNAc transferase